MSTTHFRAIGNPKEHKGTADLKAVTAPPSGMTPSQRGGPCNYGTEVDPRSGVSGNYKSRRHYPVAQEAQFCMRKMWKERDGIMQRCKNRRKCKGCINFGNYRPEHRRIGAK